MDISFYATCSFFSLQIWRITMFDFLNVKPILRTSNNPSWLWYIIFLKIALDFFFFLANILFEMFISRPWAGCPLIFLLARSFLGSGSSAMRSQPESGNVSSSIFTQLRCFLGLAGPQITGAVSATGPFTRSALFLSVLGSCISHGIYLT